MTFLLRLYPAAWRERYEDEFVALLDERQLSPFDVFDITLGALDARLRPQSLAIDLAPRRNPPMNPRISGLAAIVGGGIALLMIGIGLLFPDGDNGEAAVLLFTIVAIALLVALIGLSAAQGRRLPVLTWAAVSLPVLGLLLSLIGMLAAASLGDRAVVGGVNGWYLWSLGIAGAIVGSILFAAATVVVGVLSRGGAVTLLIGSLVVALVGLPVALGVVDPGPSPALFAALVAGGLLFCAGWIWLGAAAAFPRALPEPSEGAG
jgi:hypothetical protein